MSLPEEQLQLPEGAAQPVKQRRAQKQPSSFGARQITPGGGKVRVGSGGGGGGGGGGEDFTDAALDTAGAEQRAAYEAAVVAHEEEEVRTVRSTVPRGVYIHRKVGEMEEME